MNYTNYTHDAEFAFSAVQHWWIVQYATQVVQINMCAVRADIKPKSQILTTPPGVDREELKVKMVGPYTCVPLESKFILCLLNLRRSERTSKTEQFERTRPYNVKREIETVPSATRIRNLSRTMPFEPSSARTLGNQTLLFPALFSFSSHQENEPERNQLVWYHHRSKPRPFFLKTLVCLFYFPLTLPAHHVGLEIVTDYSGS